MTPKYITIHETANTSKGANAKAHVNLLYSGNQSRVASWHFTVDDKEIYQHLPVNKVGYHAGNGSGPGNRQSIGIEICVNSDGNFEKAKANAAWLVRYLMQKHNISQLETLYSTIDGVVKTALQTLEKVVGQLLSI